MKKITSIAIKSKIDILDQEIRSWSIVVNNLKNKDAPVYVLKCAAGIVSMKAKRIHELKKQLDGV